MSVETATPTLLPWNALPVWAALMIKATGEGLDDVNVWKGWEWSEVLRNTVIAYSGGFRYIVHKGYPYVY